MCNRQIVTRGPSSAGSKREGSGRSFAQELRIAKDLLCLKVESYGFAAKAFDLLRVRRMKQ
jgi:hypothetical protein